MIKVNKNKILTIFVFLIILSLIPSAYAMENTVDSGDHVSVVSNSSQIAVENDNDVLNSPESNVIYVDASSGDDTGTGASDSPFKTIQKGLSTVGTNGTLYLNGEFKGGSNTNLEINNINLLITSEKGATIDGGNAARIFSASNSNLVLNNLKLVNGYSSVNGGAIYINDTSSSLTISNSVFENNTVKGTSSNIGLGGAIYSNSFITFKDNVTFKNNSASYRGGAIYAVAGFNITGNNFYAIGNSVPKSSNGGFVYTNGISYISGKNMLFANNYAGGSSAISGAIYAYCSLLSISGSNITFKNNYAKAGGAAIYAYQALLINVVDAVFDNNSGQTGGAIRTASLKDFNITGNNILFSNNKATQYGGAIRSYGDCYIGGTNILFVNNSVSGDGGYNHGGAISCNNPKLTNSYNKITLNGVTFINNTAGYGGAVTVYITDIKNSTFINNTANTGGAIYALNSHKNYPNIISNSVFINNEAQTASDVGFYKNDSNNVNNNWWGDNNPTWDTRVNQNIVPASYAVLNLTANPITVGAGEATSIIANFYANNTTNNINILQEY